MLWWCNTTSTGVQFLLTFCSLFCLVQVGEAKRRSAQKADLHFLQQLPASGGMKTASDVSFSASTFVWFCKISLAVITWICWVKKKEWRQPPTLVFLPATSTFVWFCKISLAVITRICWVKKKEWRQPQTSVFQPSPSSTVSWFCKISPAVITRICWVQQRVKTATDISFSAFIFFYSFLAFQDFTGSNHQDLLSSARSEGAIVGHEMLKSSSSVLSVSLVVLHTSSTGPTK